VNLRLGIVLLLALTLRLVWALSQSTDPASLNALPDQKEYLQLGRNLLAGRGLQFTDSRFAQQVWAYRTPGYPLLIAACGGHLRVIRVVQAMLDASTVLAVYLLAGKWLPAGHSLFAATLAAVNPFLIYFTGLILTETLFIAMLAWGLALMVQRISPTRSFVSAAILALAVLVRPSALLLPAFLAVVAKRRWIIYFGATLIVLFPWALRNHFRLHEWIWTSTNSGITQYDGFNPVATGASDQSFVRDMPQLSQMDEIQRSRYLNNLAGQFIRGHPWTCVKLTLLKIGRLWSPIPLSSQFGSRPLYVAAGLIYTVPLFLLCLNGLSGLGISRRGRVLLLLPALYLTVVHGLSVSSLRYRLPAEPMLAVVAASGVRVKHG